jgi:hypothetical protein
VVLTHYRRNLNSGTAAAAIQTEKTQIHGLEKWPTPIERKGFKKYKNKKILRMKF